MGPQRSQCQTDEEETLAKIPCCCEKGELLAKYERIPL